MNDLPSDCTKLTRGTYFLLMSDCTSMLYSPRMATANRLQQAIVAARAGRHDHAYELFLAEAKANPQNLTAWLWLGELCESLDDKIIALENALDLSPANAKVQARLSELYRQRDEASQHRRREMLARAEAAKRAGRKPEAQQLLLQLVEAYEEDEAAWLLLSEVVDDVADQIVALENALTLNPKNVRAKTQAEKLRALQRNPMALGDFYRARGQLDRAQAAYYTAAANPLTSTESKQATRELDSIRDQLMGSRYVSPGLTLLRLTLGPPLLYGLMLLAQSGLNVLRLSPSLCLAGSGVVMGSLLMAASSAIPRHRLWKSLLGSQESAQSSVRFVVGALGALLIVLPFALLLMTAFERLTVYRDVFYQNLSPR